MVINILCVSGLTTYYSFDLDLRKYTTYISTPPITKTQKYKLMCYWLVRKRPATFCYRSSVRRSPQFPTSYHNFPQFLVPVVWVLVVSVDYRGVFMGLYTEVCLSVALSWLRSPCTEPGPQPRRAGKIDQCKTSNVLPGIEPMCTGSAHMVLSAQQHLNV